MKPFRIEVSPRARRQLENIKQWWQENQGLGLLEADLADVAALLKEHPEAGPAYRPPSEYRRRLMSRTQHYVYYRVMRSQGLIRIVAFWSTARGRPPRL